MKKLLSIFAISLLLLATSCQTRVVSPQKPMYDNSLELYKKYTIQTKEPKLIKMEVLKVDAEKIYGKDKNGADVTVNRNNVREIKKLDVLSSVALGAAAILAVIFVPI